MNYNYLIKMPKLFVILTLCILNFEAKAEVFSPYFASIKSSEVNVRKGPHTRYSIDWVFKKKGEPVEVIAKFEHWNKIRDISGDEGWVKNVMLSKKRMGIITADKTSSNDKINGRDFISVYYNYNNPSKVFAKIEVNRRVQLEECNLKTCKIKVNEVSGWVEKKLIWGVYLNEEFK